ncbi:PPE family protein [Mycobacterium gordonae]|uniref:PPE domain-containing protein n=1 Tax=Mycobacterium gordonae TaxID=1778 RepID=A0A1X1VZA2_MYCGO|nr:PPE family protein [Mycobacterium gordonae]MCV7009940.1 PPE family protein [Mycobacterium gordonae]ODR16929.1 hypothetical protein BHQ23_28190 [Mycobacterium gordonae]ORV76741.1 hypothetical protein AWC08_33175 [Mycobacterium gordonae]PJE02968.1 MAG: PPE family protein [Mycobacterium sp.]
MDFGIYPPEINSGRIYAGPGAGPMLAAAQAWQSVADELYTTIGGYQSAVSELVEGAWSGPSAAAMSAAAESYVEWLSATAARAEQTAAQAWTAVAAYEAAFAATVPPPEIAANRALLAVLVATNFLGQNTPAIAATEALYAEMWAQDSLAMYNYAASSAAASVLNPFTPPQQNTDPAGTAGQAAAISQTGALAGTAQGAMSVVPQALSAMAVPAELELVTLLLDLFFIAPIDAAALFAIIPADVIGTFGDFPLAAFMAVSGADDDETVSDWDEVEPLLGTEPTPEEPFVASLVNPTPRLSAALGGANTVGGLTVPSSWTQIATAAAEVRPTALVTPLASVNPAAVPAAEFNVANTVNQTGIGAMAGQPMPGPSATADGQKHAAAAQLIGRNEDASAEDVEVIPAPRTVMTGVAAAIRDIAAQRAAGLLSEQEYTEQKKMLLEISFGS